MLTAQFHEIHGIAAHPYGELRIFFWMFHGVKFFGRRGGITFSGGEPTLQAAELLPLFRRLKEAGIHICLDSRK